MGVHFRYLRLLGGVGKQNGPDYIFYYFKFQDDISLLCIEYWTCTFCESGEKSQICMVENISWLVCYFNL